MIVSDEMLMAYVDGELAPDVAAMILARLLADPELHRRLEQHRQLRDRLHDAYAPLLQEALPTRLTELLRQASIPSATNDDHRPRSLSPRRLSVHGSVWAIAAMALIGIGVTGLRQDWAGRLGLDHGDVYARGGLDRALDGQLSGESASGGVKVLASFRDKAGAYCRAYSVGGSSQGVACRADKRWRVLAFYSTQPTQEPAGAYRQASSAVDPSIAAMVETLRASEPLSLAEERMAKGSHWAPAGPPAAPNPPISRE